METVVDLAEELSKLLGLSVALVLSVGIVLVAAAYFLSPLAQKYFGRRIKVFWPENR